MLNKYIKIKIKNGAKLNDEEIDLFLEELSIETSGLKLNDYTREDGKFDIPLHFLNSNGISMCRSRIKYDIDFDMNKMNYKAKLTMIVVLIRYETGIKEFVEYKSIKIIPVTKEELM